MSAPRSPLPFATPISTCPRGFTICSAVCFFSRAIHSSACSSLPHLTSTKHAGHITIPTFTVNRIAVRMSCFILDDLASSCECKLIFWKP
jgi:hypothetical protein